MQSLTNIDDILLSQIRQVYVKIELLNKNERTIDSVEGETVAGNIAIDGNSSVRRVANITFLITKGNYKILETSNKISLNKKIRILIGIKTTLGGEEPHWFNCGIYILFKANVTVNVSGNQIALVAHDKMCLHNGTVSGKITYNTRVDAEYQIQSYNSAIATIESNMEAINKIFEDRTGASIASQIAAIKAQLTHIYTYVQEVDYPQEVLVFNMKQQCDDLLAETDDGEKRSKFKKLQDSTANLSNGAKYHKLLIRDIIKYAAISLAGEVPGRVIINDVPEKVKTPIMIDASKNKIGFKMINYVYPSELTVKTGQPITAIYDACVEALGGNFEYFYDTSGNFIFQEIKNYKNNNIVPLDELKPENYKTSYNKIAIQYNFSENNIISSYANNPEWANIKNDLYVWGSGKDYLYGYHVVIDDKPIIPDYVYDYIENKTMDWREFIIHNYNVGINHTFVGKGKEVNLSNFTSIAQSLIQKTSLIPICCITDTNKDVIYKEYKNNNWVNINLNTVTRGVEFPTYYNELSSIWFEDRYEPNFMPKNKSLYTYNFDIIEGDKDLNKFSISSIGKRTEVIDDKNIRQLYPTTVEEILVYYHDEDLQYTSNPSSAIKVSNLNDFEKYKPVGNIYKDAFSAIKNMLFKHTTFNEQITVTSMPIYYLEPNRRAYVYNNAASIDGYYLVKKINFNFSDAGLMTINMIQA